MVVDSKRRRDGLVLTKGTTWMRRAMEGDAWRSQCRATSCSVNLKIKKIIAAFLI